MNPIQASVRHSANPEKAAVLSRFFKTGKGQYGEGDVFLWVTVPVVRKAVRDFFHESDFRMADELLSSEFHEERLAWAVLLDEFARKRRFPVPEIAEFYLERRNRINNWDLVDLSSERVVWPYLFEYLPPSLRTARIDEFVKSPHLWTNRIVVIATFYEIKKGNAEPIFELAPKFFSHPHDLMHKAVGWMLREAGKRVSEARLREFLDLHAPRMPRTALRYAIERFDEDVRKGYLLRK